MKRLIVLTIFITCIFVSCNESTFFSENTQTGSIRVSLNVPNHNRVMNNTIASSVSNTYEVAAYSTTGTTIYSTAISIGSSSVLKVPIGTYYVIAFAGKKDSVVPENVYLLGAARKENVIVEKNSTNSISLNLQCCSITLTLPSSVDFESETTYNALATFDIGLSQIRPYNMDISLTGDGYNGTSTISPGFQGQIGSLTTFAANVTSPTEASIATGTFTNNNNMLLTDGNVNPQINKAYNFQNNWLLPISSEVTDLQSDIVKTIDFMFSYLNISVGWGS